MVSIGVEKQGQTRSGEWRLRQYSSMTFTVTTLSQVKGIIVV